MTDVGGLFVVPDQHSIHGVDTGTGGVPAVTGTDPYIEETVMQGVTRNQQYRPRSHPQARPMSPSTDTSATSSSTAEPDTDSQTKYNGTVPL
jgi:hypothetical protein